LLKTIHLPLPPSLPLSLFKQHTRNLFLAGKERVIRQCGPPWDVPTGSCHTHRPVEAGCLQKCLALAGEVWGLAWAPGNHISDCSATSK
jgi:hypothetical protein